MKNYEVWLSFKDQIKEMTEKLHEVEAAIWLEAEKNGNLNLKGGKTYEDDGFKITITHTDSVKVDQSKAQLRPELFKLKYEYIKGDYKNLVKSQRDFVDDAITISSGKPNFKIVRVENEFN